MKYPVQGERTVLGQWICYNPDCNKAIDPFLLVWLGEHEPQPFAVPMHSYCAEGAWPMYPLNPADVQSESH